MSRKRGHKQDRNDQESPKRLSTQLSITADELETFFMLPSNVLDYILIQCNISDLRKLGMVSKRCRDLVLGWLEKDRSMSIFSALMNGDAEQYSVKYQIRGSNQLHGFNPNIARKNFNKLGIMVKQLTCLFPTNQRMEISGKLLSRISLYDNSSPNCELMNCCGMFLHSLVKGWGSDECKLASVTVIEAFNSNGALSAVIDKKYTMGSDPLLEVNIHSFLFSMFWQDVKNKKMWLLLLLNHVAPDLSPHKLAKILLLQFSLPRNHFSPLGLYWEDHSEAVPATAEVANSRYQHLVSGLSLLQGHISLPQILEQIFKIPEQWIPENVGSVLLLSGPILTKDFLLYQVGQVLSSDKSWPACPTCYQSVADTIAGLLWMTVRFRESVDTVMSYIDMVISSAPDRDRPGFYSALWTVLAKEARDLQDLVEEGEEWALEGVKVVYTAIRKLGQRLTQKAYGRIAATNKNIAVESEE